MKHRQKATYFLSGILAALLVVTMVSPAMAALTNKTIQVRSGVGIYIDGEKLNPTDVTGKPVETFIYNGTTYVPIRAVSTAFGKSIRYDSPTQSVYIGEAPGTKSYLLTVCPPYQSHRYYTQATYTMAGKKYANGFTLGSLPEDYALFNLNGEYDMLSFELGHIDGRGDLEGQYNIYLDGELKFSAEVNSEMLPKHYDVPLNGAIQMKIQFENFDSNWATYDGIYAMVNVTVS